MPFQIDGRGDMNAFVLTSPLAGVMLLTRRQPFYPSAAHDKFFSICTAFGGYTKFGIAPFFPKAVKNIINILILLVTIVTLLFLGYLSIQYMMVFANSGRTTAVLHISYILIYCIVPISCIWQIFNFVLVNFFHYSEQETIEAITEEEFEEAKKE